MNYNNKESLSVSLISTKCDEKLGSAYTDCSQKNDKTSLLDEKANCDSQFNFDKKLLNSSKSTKCSTRKKKYKFIEFLKDFFLNKLYLEKLINLFTKSSSKHNSKMGRTNKRTKLTNNQNAASQSISSHSYGPNASYVSPAATISAYPINSPEYQQEKQRLIAEIRYMMYDKERLREYFDQQIELIYEQNNRKIDNLMAQMDQMRYENEKEIAKLQGILSSY
ncbi:uncharacterized protein ASCRUDRAFT_75058, partial [Ascoidea rubescens DSM 1968]